MSETQTEPTKRSWTKKILLAAIALAIVWPASVLFLRQIRAEEGARRALVQFQATSAQETQSRQLASRIQQLRGDANKEERERLLAEMNENLEAEFDARHQRQADDIEAAEQRLNSIKEVFARRTELKEQIIQRRVNELIGQGDVLDWDPAAVTNQVQAFSKARNLQPRPVLSPLNSPRNPNSIVADAFVRKTDATAPTSPPTFDNPMVQQTDRRQVSSSTVRVDAAPRWDVFAVARRLITSRLAAQTATEQLEGILKAAGGYPKSALSAARAKAQQANAEAALAEAEMKTLQRRLERDSEFASENEDRAQSLLKQAKSRYSNGTAQAEEVMKADGAVAEAQKQREELHDIRGVLGEALKLIETSTAADEATADAIKDEDDILASPTLPEDPNDNEPNDARR